MGSSIWNMDKYFIRYNPTFFVSPVQLVKYLSFETRFKAEYLCGQKTISNPELYFQYYLDKMDAGPTWGGAPGPKDTDPHWGTPGPRKYRWTQQD